MFKPGYIRKIVVVNFVTYSYAEVYPGPNLNMLIGPNGTGKSTIVAAIILGLGGSPKTVGRGTKVSGYVKHDCSVAEVNIYLQGNSEDEFIKLTRQFTLDDKSTWKINDQKCASKEFMQFIKQFNVQVDNLCQFLPQDRVQDFAKMNKQELLKQTQVAVCREDLMLKQEQLIGSRTKQTDVTKTVESLRQKLDDAVNANLQLQSKVRNFQKKKEFLGKIKDIERKMAWTMYEDFKQNLNQAEEQKEKIRRELDKRKEMMKPLESALLNARRGIQNVQTEITEANNRLQRAFEAVEKEKDAYKNLKKRITAVQNEKNTKLRALGEHANQLLQCEGEINNLMNEKKVLLEQLEGGDAMVEQQIRTQRKKISDINAQIHRIQEQIETMQRAKDNKTNELRYLQNNLSQLEGAKNARLNLLARIDKGAHTGVQWLYRNKNMFRSVVYGPMLLEINVHDPSNAIYLENTISLRDRVAFTCTSKEDVQLLGQELRIKQKLRVNILFSPLRSNAEYRPQIPIEQLRRYGFFSYLNSLFTAPEPIVNYLCKFYRLHKIPAGTDQTDDMYKDIPNTIGLFFSRKYRYGVSYSKYTKQKSFSQNNILPNNTLSIVVDEASIGNARGQVEEAQNSVQRFESQLDVFNVQIQQFNAEAAMLRMKTDSIQKVKRQASEIDNKIEQARARLQNMQRNATTREVIEQEADAQLKDIVKKMVLSQESIKNAYKTYTASITKLKLKNIKLLNVHKDVEYLSTKYKEVQTSYNAHLEHYESAKREYHDARRRERLAFEKAKDLTNGVAPRMPGFEIFRRAFDELPNSLEQLESEKDDIASRVDCLTAADDRELEEYESRENLIEELRGSLGEKSGELENLTNLLDNAEQEWLRPLEELVGEINRRFGASFERMGCVGEVSVCKGADEKDYSQYGLSIKVSYRDGEPIQELNTTVQSGGERAVATATFMLSLQELTPVPFRCVDEINQGMDANNERRIFDLLVDSTSQPDTSQYFLITPKLVPNLKFVDTMKIHIVHNGPFLSPAEEWYSTKLCNPDGLQIC